MKKRKLYEKPATRVFELKQQPLLQAVSDGNGGGMPGGVPAEPFLNPVM